VNWCDCKMREVNSVTAAGPARGEGRECGPDLWCRGNKSDGAGAS
jgi:hypothetical protein